MGLAGWAARTRGAAAFVGAAVLAAGAALAAWVGVAVVRPPSSAENGAASAGLERALRLAAETPPHADCFVSPAQFEKAVEGAPRVAAEVAAGRGEPVAAVVPHHVVAGRLAAGLLAYLAADPPETLVIVGPDHAGAGPPVGTSFGVWRTAFGPVEVDAPLTAALLDSGLAREAWAVHDKEHSLGALMPFVKSYLPRTKVVAVTVRRDLSLTEAAALGRFLAERAPAEGRLFVLASVDFSHYLPLAEADRRDAATLAALRAGDWASLFAMGPGNLDSPAALAVAFSFAGALEAPDFQVVEHTNSALLLGQPDSAETTSHFLLLVRARPGL